MTERTFTCRFLRAAKERGWFTRRIETAMTGYGVPDLWAITPFGIPVWIEFKHCNRDFNVLNYENAVPWRKGQREFLREISKRMRFGKCGTAVQTPSKFYFISPSINLSIDDVYEFDRFNEFMDHCDNLGNILHP